jgi:hypothetical protein
MPAADLWIAVGKDGNGAAGTNREAVLRAIPGAHVGVVKLDCWSLWRKLGGGTTPLKFTTEYRPGWELQPPAWSSAPARRGA